MEGRMERQGSTWRVMRLLRRDEDVVVGVGLGILVASGMEMAFGHLLREKASQDLAKEIISTAVGTGVDLVLASGIRTGIHHCLRLLRGEAKSMAANQNAPAATEADIFGCVGGNRAA